ncbi:MAG: DUF3883 domain-containing protein [Candidatus Bathyarchaeia archaeon]
MSTGLLNQSGSSTGFECVNQAKLLVKSIIDSFKYHPLFFMLRSSVTSEDPVYPFAHQLELLGKLFARKPIRVLIGDEIGLGKTVSAIMIIKYLLEAEKIRRILILVPRVLVQQWLSELKRFNLTNIHQLERNTIAGYQTLGFPEGIYLASIDLIKRNEHKVKILNVKWDLIVVDEAHRVGKSGGDETQRFILVKEIVKDPSVNIVMLTATPHRGKPEDYIERLKLVDPFIKASPRELDNERFYRLCMNSIVFRRTKPDVNSIYEKRRVFTDCKFKARVVKASEKEEEFHRNLLGFLRAKLLHYYRTVGEEPKALPLMLTLIAKRASSSPRAAIITLDRILQKRARLVKLLNTSNRASLERDLDEKASLIADTILGYSFEDMGLYEDESGKTACVDEILEEFVEECSVLLSEDDVKQLRRLHELAKEITGDEDSRLNSLINIVHKHIDNGEKVVVFTEFRDTAEYIFAELKRRLPKNHADKVALITSKGVEPPTPYSWYRRSYGIEDVKKWLRDGDVEVLVSTDVASEGLNLQMANVVIHYEPTWSPVKIVQRLGRVWRLGQEKDVCSYSLLLTVESDLAALEILYAKLLSWIVSGIEKQVPIGEELEIDMLPKDKTSSDILQIPLTSERGRPQYSEFRAWMQFIANGKEGLRRYVEGIINALIKLKEQAQRLGLSRVEPVKVEKFLSEGLGGLYGKEGEAVLKDLLVTTARICGYDVEERGSGLFVKGTHLTGLKTPLDFYRAIVSIVKDATGRTPVTLIASKPSSDEYIGLREIYLYEVPIYVGGRPSYSEVVGVVVREDGSTEVRRGLNLLKTFNGLLGNIIGVGDYFLSGKDFYDAAKNTVLYNYRSRMQDEYIKYLTETEKNISFSHVGWLPREGVSSSLESRQPRFLGAIVVLDETVRTPPPQAVEEVERRAMEYAMKYEKESGRLPEDVSKMEHYDIRSVDPKTGEVRYIEVKGRWYLDVTVELTEAEYEYAKKLKDNYWLYIIYGFSTGTPRLLAIRDPVRNIQWEVVVEVIERTRRRYRLSGYKPV